MPSTIPEIEVSDDTDTLRIRRPDGEQRTGNAFDNSRVGPQKPVRVPVSALVECVEVGAAELRRKRVSVVALVQIAFIVGPQQTVVFRHYAGLVGALEQLRLADAVQAPAPVFDPDLSGPRQIDPYNILSIYPVTTEQDKRIVMPCLDQTNHVGGVGLNRRFSWSHNDVRRVLTSKGM